MLWALAILAAVPSLGPERPVDPTTGPGAAELSVQQRPALAALPSAGNLYAVWEDFREGEGAQVWGVALSVQANGALSFAGRGERLSPLLPYDVEHTAPAIAGFSAAGSTGYLVSWQMAVPGGLPKVLWRYVPTNGPVLAAQPNEIGPGALPAVACVADTCLLAYTDLTVPAVPRLKAKQLRATLGGLVEVPSSIDIPVMGPPRDVAVTAVPELRGWALAWLSHPTTTSAVLNAAFMSPDGGTFPAMGHTLATTSSSATALGPPAITSFDGGALVAFTAPSAGAQPVWTVMMSTGGASMSAAVPRAAAGKIAMDPSLDFDGTSVNLVWSELSGISFRLVRQRFRPTDAVVSDVPITGPGFLTVHRWPSVASLSAGPNRNLVMAFEASLLGLSDVYAYNEVNDQPLGAMPLSVSDDAQGRVAVTWAEDAFVGAWLDSRRRDPLISLYAARFLPDAGRISPSVLMLPDAGVLPDQPALAAGAGRVMLVWKERLGAQGIYAKRLTAMLDTFAQDPPQGVLVSAGMPVDGESPPAVASNGTDFLAAWASADGGAYYRRGTGDLVPLEAGPVSLSTRGAARFPSAVWDGRSWLIAWQHGLTADSSQVALARLSFDAGTSLNMTVDVAPAAAAQHRPLVLSDRKGTSLVLWTEERAGWVLRCVVVNSGQVGSSAFDVATGLLRPALQPLSGGFDGEDFQVVFRRRDRDLEMATIRLNGTVSMTGPAVRFAGKSPSVAYSPTGAGLSLYERFDVVPNTTRAYLRGLTEGRGVVVVDAGTTDGGGAPPDAGIATDGGAGTPDGGGALDAGAPAIVAPSLFAQCGAPLDVQFQTADGSPATWERVEGPGELSADGRYLWEGALVKTHEHLVVRATTAGGTTVSSPLDVETDCVEALEFATCACGHGAWPLLPLLLLGLRRRNTRSPSGW